MTGTLSERDLVEIIRKQATALEESEAVNRILQVEIARLKKRIEELERKNRNYVSPHSRETRKADPKPPGRRAGEGIWRYKAPPPPEQVVDTIAVERPNQCSVCGFKGELTFKRLDKAWISELITDHAIQITAYSVPVMQCPQCGAQVRGQHADLAADQFGATAHRCGKRLNATVQLLHHEIGVPQRRIPRVLELMTGLRLTQGAVTQAAGRLARDGSSLAGHAQELEKAVQTACYVHHDDTGWRVNASPAWVSVFRSLDTVVFKVNERHTNTELRAGLGKAFEGVLVCDRFKVYDSQTLTGVRQQKCLSHLIRNADEVAAQQQRRPGRGHEYAKRMAQVFRDGVRLHHAFHLGLCTRAAYDGQGEELTLRLDQLLQRAPLKARENERLRLGLLSQHLQGRLLLFLSDPEIPPTNNAAERSLRSVVMARKVSQCSKNARGATTYMRIKSTVETARLRGQDPIEVLISLTR